MSAYTEHLARFRAAVERGDLARAVEEARGMRASSGERLTLSDSLDLLVLLARDGDQRFEQAAVRWLARLAGDDRPLAELQVAVAGLLGLQSPITFSRSRLLLQDLLTWVPTDAEAKS